MASMHLRFLLVLLLGVALHESEAQERGQRVRSTTYTNVEDAGLKSIPVDPSHVIQLSWHPRVFLYRGFLSAAECDHLISLAHEKSNNSVDANDSTGIATTSIWVGANDEISRRIQERISAWTFLQLDHRKGFQILHFGPEKSNGEYHYFDTRTAEEGGQTLLATVILYLSDVSKGGQIIFPNSQETSWSGCTKNSIDVHPRRGNAILFFSLNLNASPDQSSSHARCPILEGEMWCATKFLYLKRPRQETNLLLSNEGDCTDEDENCPSWAAAGECGRNPVFMVGSPDYYGTCRKSCNACSL